MKNKGSINKAKAVQRQTKVTARVSRLRNQRQQSTRLPLFLMPSARLEGSCWSAGMTHRTLWELSHSQLQFTARKEYRLTSAREEMHKVKSGGSMPLPAVESGQWASPGIGVWQHSWRLYHPPGKLTPASVFRVFTGSSVTTEYAAEAPLSKSQCQLIVRPVPL